MSKFILLSVAGAAIAFASPALAAGDDSGKVNGAAPTAAPTAAAAHERRYCVVSEVTGSRIPIKTCKTRKEWLAENFDPLAK